MAPRVQVDTGLRPATLRPVASPVQPVERADGGTKLAQLAQGLATIAPEVRRLTGILTEQRNEESREAGVALARKLANEGKTLAQATQQGLIPKTANPFFMAGVREQFGRVMADKWHDQLIADAGKNEKLRTSTRLEDFEAFAQDHLKTWLESNVPEDQQDRFFQTGFGFRSDTYMHQVREEFARGIEEKVTKLSDEVLFAESRKAVRAHYGKVDRAALTSSLEKLADDMIQQGRDKRQVNLTMARAVVSVAEELAESGGDALGVLNLLKEIKAGPSPLYDKPDVTALYNAAYDKIADRLWTLNQRERERVAQEREDRSRTVHAEVVQLLAENPSADLTKYAQRLRDVPGAPEMLIGLQRNMTVMQFRTDEEVKRDLFTRIWTAEGPDRVTSHTVIRWLNKGKLTTGDAAWLISMIEQRDAAARGGGSEFVNDFDFRQQLSNISRRFQTPLGLFGVSANQADQAEALFRAEWTRLNLSGEAAKMSPLQKIEWLSQTANRIVSQYLDPASRRMNDRKVAPAFPAESTGTAAPATAPAASTGSALPALPDTSVISTEEWQQIAAERRAGVVGPVLTGFMQRYQLTDSARANQFFQTQLDLLRQGKTKKTP